MRICAFRFPYLDFPKCSMQISGGTRGKSNEIFRQRNIRISEWIPWGCGLQTVQHANFWKCSIWMWILDREICTCQNLWWLDATSDRATCTFLKVWYLDADLRQCNMQISESKIFGCGLRSMEYLDFRKCDIGCGFQTVQHADFRKCNVRMRISDYGICRFQSQNLKLWRLCQAPVDTHTHTHTHTHTDFSRVSPTVILHSKSGRKMTFENAYQHGFGAFNGHMVERA